jgi:hypothetical protein
MYRATCFFLGPRTGKTATFDYFRMISLPTKKQQLAFRARKEIDSDRPEFVDVVFNLKKKDKNEPTSTFTIRVTDIDSRKKDEDKFDKLTATF